MKFYLRTISYFKGDYGRIIASMLLVAASTLLGLIWLLPWAVLTDTVLLGKQSDNFFYQLFYKIMPDDASGKATQIIFLASATLLIRLLAVGLTTVQTFLNIRIGYNGQMRVRCDLFQKLQALSLAYHKSQPQGDAIHRLSYDTNGFQAVLNVLIGILVNVLTLVGMIWIMVSFHVRLTLISLIVIPPLVLTIRLYGKVLKKRYEQAYAVDTELTTAIQRSVSTIGVVQAFGREADEFAQFHSTVGNTIRTRMRLHWDEIMYWLILGSIFAIGAAAIFGYGGLAVYRNELEVGALGLFLGFVDKLYDPLNKLSSSGAGLAGGIAQVQRVFEVLDRDPVIKDASDARHLPVQQRTLSLDHVTFEYRKGAMVLDDISCEIMPGQMVAFVGSSGVGKTTLLNLLPRFYDPVNGAMRLDGIDVRGIKIADVRKHIALVLQESVILPTSVAENIAYGRPDATDAQIRAAAEQAGASVFIEKMDHQYDEQISESGQNLSGGQKQRISIARALVTESPIIVMDEPTSALDPHHEALIVETLKRLKGLRTIILVSHRLSTVSDCDQIFVMDAGKIVERGKHQELIRQRGLYFQMAKHQMKIEDVPTSAIS